MTNKPQRLSEWVLGLTPGDLPETPFQIHPWSTIRDKELWLRVIQAEVRTVLTGKMTPRHYTGALKSDLDGLFRVMNGGENE
ncbi:MAG: hypothetical protein M0P69_21065 [Bacteroidales bacterium]|nr:hypothetical protein [Bacteroidales bacterium]